MAKTLSGQIFHSAHRVDRREPETENRQTKGFRLHEFKESNNIKWEIKEQRFKAHQQNKWNIYLFIFKSGGGEICVVLSCISYFYSTLNWVDECTDHITQHMIRYEILFILDRIIGQLQSCVCNIIFITVLFMDAWVICKHLYHSPRSTCVLHFSPNTKIMTQHSSKLAFIQIIHVFFHQNTSIFSHFSYFNIPAFKTDNMVNILHIQKCNHL